MTGAPMEKDKRDTFVTHVLSPGPCTLCVENYFFACCSTSLFGGSAFGRCCTWWPKLELLWAFRHAFLGHLCHLDVAARALKGAQKRKGVQQISYEHSKWSLITWERCHLRNGAENLGPALLPSKLHRELFLCMLLYIPFWWQCFWQMLHLVAEAGTSMGFSPCFPWSPVPLGCRRTSFEGCAKKEGCAADFL